MYMYIRSWIVSHVHLHPYPLLLNKGQGLWCFKCHFQQYFNHIVAVSFIGGGNQSAQRKPPTCHKALAYYIT